MSKISIKEGASLGFGVLVEHWKPILELVLKMLPAFFIISISQQYLTNPMASELARTTPALIFIGLLVAIPMVFWLLAPFHVSIYRLILRNEPIDTNCYSRLLQPRELSYFWMSIKYTLMIMLAYLLIVIPAGLLAATMVFLYESVILRAILISLLLIGAIFGFVFLSLRFYFVLPAISIGTKLGFRNSYNMLKGHTVRFFLCLLLASIPFAIFSVTLAIVMRVVAQSIVNLSLGSLASSLLGVPLAVPMVVVVAYTFNKVSNDSSREKQPAKA